MFPLNVILVGCGGELLPLLRLELSVHGARIEQEFLGVESVIAALRSPPQADDRRGPANGRAKPDPAASELPRKLFGVRLQSASALPHLKRLSASFPGFPILALLNAPGDPNAAIGAMRMGASQVVLLPLQSEDFKAALDCIAVQCGQTVANQVIAVAGVTGGCGATTIAINLAYEFAHLHQRRTVLAELSLQMGKLPLYLNVDPRYTTHEILREIHRLD